jgi:hypothetical protein
MISLATCDYLPPSMKKRGVCLANYLVRGEAAGYGKVT